MKTISNLDLINKIKNLEQQLDEKELFISNLKLTCRDLKEEIEFLRKLILTYLDKEKIQWAKINHTL